MKRIKDLIADNFNGVIYISKNGEPIFNKAYGYADLPNKRPNNTNTIFEVASGSKAFVATGIMKLIESGKLSLESNIGKLLDFDLGQIPPQITVRQLLSHTSGIPDYFDESVMEDMSELWAAFPCYLMRNPKDMLPTFIGKPMMYNPGEKFQYNNAGYTLLAMIIEGITGIEFSKYLNELIFKPCGMESTGYYELDRLPANCATAYIYDEERGEYFSNIYSTNAKSDGAGGVYTTTRDIASFWKHLFAGDIVNSETVKTMVTAQAADEDGDGVYGFGFWLDGDTPYIQGMDPGVSFMSRRNTSGVLTILMSNFCDDVWEINENIEDLFDEA
ncbi:MAG: beta-lactamase family protein [Defluviitaleaceae bacterium]|nr:beta-lactamase family protein [Defluviitaleaceae bacterium]